MGILLGYGAYNGACEARMEALLAGGAPSFGFASAEEERTWLEERSQVSVEGQREGSPVFPWFGVYDGGGSSSLLRQYAQEREKVAKVLSSERRVERILSRICGQSLVWPSVMDRSFPFSREEAIEVVALMLWYALEKKEAEYLEEFCRGMWEIERGGEVVSLEAAREKPEEMAYFAGGHAWRFLCKEKERYPLPLVEKRLQEMLQTEMPSEIDAKREEQIGALSLYLCSLCAKKHPESHCSEEGRCE